MRLFCYFGMHKWVGGVCSRCGSKAKLNDGMMAFAQTGNLAQVIVLVSCGADVNAGGVVTPLVSAATGGHTDIVSFLIEKGAQVNAKTRDGFTALMCAAMGGHAGVAKLLIEHGADVNVNASGDGKTALMHAAKGGHVDVVKLLIAKGAEVNVEWTGLTALNYAVRGGHDEVVELLKAAGAPWR